MDSLSHPWHRPDPITLRRYLDAIRQQGLPRAQTPPTRFVHTNDSNYQMTHQSKKKRIDEETLPADAGTKPIQLQRRRVWRACESCRCVYILPVPPLTLIDRRRKKIKCDGCEPTCAQCQASGSQCTWLQTKDRAALSRQYAFLFQMTSLAHPRSSYVQELEARLLHMESLFTQITPLLEQLGPSPNLPSTSGQSHTPGTSTDDTQPAAPIPQALTSKAASDVQTDSSASPESSGIKMEDDVSESFGQLALDEHGHMRWIGGSSTMSLIQSFRALTSNPLHRVSPMEEDPRAPGPSANKLYFPASVFFGKVHALPRAVEVEFPEEDLCDKLVSCFTKYDMACPSHPRGEYRSKYTSSACTS